MATKFLEVCEGLRFQSSLKPGDEKTRTLEFSLSSEEPLKLYDWWSDEYYYEILGHGDDEVDLGRLKTGALPLLFDHDTRSHLGSIEECRLTDAKLFVKSKFSQSALGQEKWQDVQDGVLRSSSVRYRIHEFEKWGEREGAPIYRATNWEVIEASLVPVPADPTVGVGRSLEYQTSGGGKILLPKYRVPVVNNRSLVPDRRSLDYYMPNEDFTIGRAALALEALIENVDRMSGDSDERDAILQQGYKSFTQGVRKKMALKAENTAPVVESGGAEDKGSVNVSDLQRQLDEVRSEREADRRALEAAQKQLHATVLQRRYDQVRARVQALTSPDGGTITPATMAADFAANAQDDHTRIQSGELTEDSIAFLEKLATRYESFPRQSRSLIPFELNDERAPARTKETVERSVKKSVQDFAREFSGVKVL